MANGDHALVSGRGGAVAAEVSSWLGRLGWWENLMEILTGEMEELNKRCEKY